MKPMRGSTSVVTSAQCTVTRAYSSRVYGWSRCAKSRSARHGPARRRAPCGSKRFRLARRAGGTPRSYSATGKPIFSRDSARRRSTQLALVLKRCRVTIKGEGSRQSEGRRAPQRARRRRTNSSGLQHTTSSLSEPPSTTVGAARCANIPSGSERSFSGTPTSGPPVCARATRRVSVAVARSHAACALRGREAASARGKRDAPASQGPGCEHRRAA